MLMDKVTDSPRLPKTPSGQSLQKTRNMVLRLKGDKRMRRTIKAALKAMGLPDAIPDSAANQIPNK